MIEIMSNYLPTYSHWENCGDKEIFAKYVVNNLVMCENRVNTHTHTHTHTHILTANLRALIYSFLGKSQTGVSRFSSHLSISFSDICSQCGASPLRVAARVALHHHITALSVGTHRALSITPYSFCIH